MFERLFAQAIVSFARTLTGVHAWWRQPLPTRPGRVYFGNHNSHGDFVLLWSCLTARERLRTRPVAGADYWNSSALKLYVASRVFRALLIDRTKPAPGEQRPDPVQQMAAALATGDSLILFPEGTRNLTDQKLLPFKSGLFHLSEAHPDAELVPVWISNLNRVMPKGELIPLPLICSVHFGAPLEKIASEDKATFLARAQTALLDLDPDRDHA